MPKNVKRYNVGIRFPLDWNIGSKSKNNLMAIAIAISEVTFTAAEAKIFSHGDGRVVNPSGVYLQREEIPALTWITMENFQKNFENFRKSWENITFFQKILDGTSELFSVWVSAALRFSSQPILPLLTAIKNPLFASNGCEFG
ncbi:hypothetical protein YC2023_009466 [Brassica napus]